MNRVVAVGRERSDMKEEVDLRRRDFALFG
jgi:hypothetical protein